VIYYTVPYDGSTPDYVVLDRRYPGATPGFLEQFPNVAP
jgi:hypothetical protein